MSAIFSWLEDDSSVWFIGLVDTMGAGRELVYVNLPRVGTRKIVLLRKSTASLFGLIDCHTATPAVAIDGEIPDSVFEGKIVNELLVGPVLVDRTLEAFK